MLLFTFLIKDKQNSMICAVAKTHLSWPMSCFLPVLPTSIHDLYSVFAFLTDVGSSLTTGSSSKSVSKTPIMNTQTRGTLNAINKHHKIVLCSKK